MTADIIPALKSMYCLGFMLILRPSGNLLKSRYARKLRKGGLMLQAALVHDLIKVTGFIMSVKTQKNLDWKYFLRFLMNLLCDLDLLPSMIRLTLK